ncbi:protein of unknown function [Blastococcus saxobsidens DD2]|uniref:Uncharacterized protein n=1 Tax=Blastococcus saxobsidens (strain DD2) TaxID=1146883 RepID=H6RVL5_BLASD|nr:protein of unknown function [Blastococcus saxobsidens DD2]
MRGVPGERLPSSERVDRVEPKRRVARPLMADVAKNRVRRPGTPDRILRYGTLDDDGEGDAS